VSETVALCAPDDLASGQARRFDVSGHRIALVRVGDTFHAIDDECSHEDYSLSEGEVWVAECEIECPRHGSMFDLVTGEPSSLPATRPVKVYEVKVEDDAVAVVLP
jgi:3-phenylpropionate/trans-cinnamate dioxygenase ferredoxin component